MKLLLSLAAVLMLAVAIPVAHAATVTNCPPGTTDVSYCETTSGPAATVSIVGRVKLLATRSRALVLDTGIRIGCQGSATANCGGSTIVTGPIHGRTVVLGRQGWRVRNGRTLRLTVPLNVKRYQAALRRLRTIGVTVQVRSHGGLAGRKRVTTRHATIRLR